MSLASPVAPASFGARINQKCWSNLLLRGSRQHAPRAMQSSPVTSAALSWVTLVTLRPSNRAADFGHEGCRQLEDCRKLELGGLAVQLSLRTGLARAWRIPCGIRGSVTTSSAASSLIAA